MSGANAKIQIRSIPNRGRGVVATSNIYSGELIISEAPLLIVVNATWKKQVCANCFRMPANIQAMEGGYTDRAALHLVRPIKCSGCQEAWFCGEACQKAARTEYGVHSPLFCAALKTFNARLLKEKAELAELEGSDDDKDDDDDEEEEDDADAEEEEEEEDDEAEEASATKASKKQTSSKKASSKKKKKKKKQRDPDLPKGVDPQMEWEETQVYMLMQLFLLRYWEPMEKRQFAKQDLAAAEAKLRTAHAAEKAQKSTAQKATAQKGTAHKPSSKSSPSTKAAASSAASSSASSSSSSSSSTASSSSPPTLAELLEHGSGLNPGRTRWEKACFLNSNGVPIPDYLKKNLEEYHSHLMASMDPRVYSAKDFEAMKELELKLRSNCYALMSPSCSQDQFLNIRAIAIYHVASMPNHDCMPNATRWDDTEWRCETHDAEADTPLPPSHVPSCCLAHDDLTTTLAMRHYAVTDIKAGDEVTISYCYAFEDVHERQDTTVDHYGFNCACFRCVAELRALRLLSQRKVLREERKAAKGGAEYKPSAEKGKKKKGDKTAADEPLVLSAAEQRAQSGAVQRIRDYVRLYVCNPPERLLPFDDAESDAQIRAAKRARKEAAAAKAAKRARREQEKAERAVLKLKPKPPSHKKGQKPSAVEESEEVDADALHTPAPPAEEEEEDGWQVVHSKEADETDEGDAEAEEEEEEEQEDERPLCNGTLIRRTPRQPVAAVVKAAAPSAVPARKDGAADPSSDKKKKDKRRAKQRQPSHKADDAKQSSSAPGEPEGATDDARQEPEGPADAVELMCNACLRVLTRPRQKLDRADL